MLARCCAHLLRSETMALQKALSHAPLSAVPLSAAPLSAALAAQAPCTPSVARNSNRCAHMRMWPRTLPSGCRSSLVSARRATRACLCSPVPRQKARPEVAQPIRVGRRQQGEGSTRKLWRCSMRSLGSSPEAWRSFDMQRRRRARGQICASIRRGELCCACVPGVHRVGQPKPQPMELRRWHLAALALTIHSECMRP